MVDCTEFLDGYSEFRDGLLSGERLLCFQAHIDACESCARYDRVIDQGIRVFRELPAVEPSCDFIPRLQHQIYHLEAERRRPGRLSSGTSVAFTLTIAAVIGVSAWMPAMRPRPGVFRLAPVAAHAPHRVEAVQLRFHPTSVIAPLPAQPPSSPTVGNLLFYRYSPLGSNVLQPAGLTVPQ